MNQGASRQRGQRERRRHRAGRPPALCPAGAVGLSCPAAGSSGLLRSVPSTQRSPCVLTPCCPVLGGLRLSRSGFPLFLSTPLGHSEDLAEDFDKSCADSLAGRAWESSRRPDMPANNKTVSELGPEPEPGLRRGESRRLGAGLRETSN